MEMMIMLTNPHYSNQPMALSRGSSVPAVSPWRTFAQLGDLGHEGIGRSLPSTAREANRLRISRSDGVVRSQFEWGSGTAEIIRITGNHRIDLRAVSRLHLTILHDRGARREGESSIEGVPVSPLRDFARRLTFVPAGHAYHEWMAPRSPVRLVCFYFDPDTVEADDENPAALPPRLFFEDAPLLESMGKLRVSLEGPSSRKAGYIAALAMMLAHEIIRVGEYRGSEIQQGGLAPWQQRVVTAYIDEHLSETVRLATLARLARLSTFHFCRAFKQTFGVPPHRYHTDRRIEHAKDLLAERRQTVTDIGLTVGYSETSSFSAAFRKNTGLTPSAYRRNLG
jgi:AraC family transcriptional regulator